MLSRVLLCYVDEISGSTTPQNVFYGSVVQIDFYCVEVIMSYHIFNWGEQIMINAITTIIMYDLDVFNSRNYQYDWHL